MDKVSQRWDTKSMETMTRLATMLPGAQARATFQGRQRVITPAPIRVVMVKGVDGELVSTVEVKAMVVAIAPTTEQILAATVRPGRRNG